MTGGPHWVLKFDKRAEQEQMMHHTGGKILNLYVENMLLKDTGALGPKQSFAMKVRLPHLLKSNIFFAFISTENEHKQFIIN